jgi:hypothetical protein
MARASSAPSRRQPQSQRISAAARGPRRREDRVASLPGELGRSAAPRAGSAARASSRSATSQAGSFCWISDTQSATVSTESTSSSAI